MLSCEEFQLLDELMQEQLLKIDGVFLMRRKTSKLHAELFALYDFYVEVFLEKSATTLLYIKAYDSVNKLDAYLENIIIDGLIRNIEHPE
jgi:hypothetical protein